MSFHDKGIGYFFPPSVRERFGPLVRGATQLFRTTPYNPTATRDLLTSTANISRGGALPIIDATGRFITTGVTQFLEANPLTKLGAGPIIKSTKKASEIGGEIGKNIDKKIVDLINKIGSKKAAKAEEILKDLDDEALMLTRPDDIMNILNEGGLEGSVSPNVAKNIKNLIKKKRGIETRFFNIDFSTEKGTQAKKIFDDVYSGVITKGEGAIKLQELYPTAKLGFVDVGAMKQKKKPTVTPRFGEVFEDYVNKFKEGEQPVAVEGKVFKAGRFYSDLGPTYNTVIKDVTKRQSRDTPKFYKVYDQLDDKNKVVVENFLESALPFFAKGENRSGPMMKMRELIARMYKSKSRKGVSDEELFKQLDDVNMKTLTNVLKQNQFLVNKIKDANAQGINLSSFNLSHIADVSNNWKNTLDANNLYFLETKLNLSDSRRANKQITKLLEQAKKAKTKGEENRVLEKINALGEVLESKNLITKVEGQTFGAKNVDSKSSFERIKKNLEKEYSEKDVGVVDYAGGGLATMAHMTRPLDGTR